MSTSILLIPVDPNVKFSPLDVARVVRSIWAPAREFSLAGEPFDVRVEVQGRSLNVRIGKGLVSISPGSTLDDCAIVAHRILQGFGGEHRFHYMDNGNSHALLVDRRTSLEDLARLPQARPLGG